ncbi:34892_t:CDS:2, partial [Gigaspora margarita]
MRIVALFDLPANVFADSGVNTTLIIAYKPKANELEKLQKENYSIFIKNIKKVGYEIRTSKRIKFFNPLYKINEQTFEIEQDEKGEPLLDEEFTNTIKEFKKWRNNMITTKYKEILNLRCNLSPSQLNLVDIPNKNTVVIKNLLDRKLNFSDKGTEVGSINYVSQSTHYFIRARALQANYFLPFLDNETVIAIRPQIFKNFNLKEGDLIISKDSNIGEAIILDKDYPNFTISGALYKLPITKNKLYLFAFFKHHHFREQLNLLVPKGSTIRHAKTLFLDCKIPFPNQKNFADVVKYVELLTQGIINKEKEIRRKNQLIFELIEKELLENQKKEEFKYERPKFSELFSNLRIDSSYYCYDYKRKQFLISNYKHGVKVIDEWNFKIKRGQNLQ